MKLKVSKQRKYSDLSKTFDREDKTRHQFKAQKNLQEKKIMKNLDKALRSKDYQKLATIDDY